MIPLFKKQNIPYPPDKIILLGIKAEKTLEVWAAGHEGIFKKICTYPILAASGKLGPKLKEGDFQVPEGIYGIEYLNPNSKFHLSLRINYPNDFDKKIANKDGRTDLGGDIMIHGSDVSIGCLAMGDEGAEDLFVLVAESGRKNVNVILSPIDFRKPKNEIFFKDLPEWVRAKYRRIKQEIRILKK